MNPFRRRTRQDDLNAEIRSHLDMATQDRVDRGAAPDEAAAAAKRELGNISQIQEATRDVWGGRWLERLAQDLRYALRTFRRNPSFAIVAILSLALGIGANTALFQVVDAVRLRALPVADPGSLLEVRLTDMEGARGNFETWRPSVTHPIWREIQARQQAFSGLFAWGTETFNLNDGGELRAVSGLWASGSFFDVLGLRPIVGRLLGPDDDRPGCPARVVLSHGYWERAFGRDPLVVGRVLTLGSHRAEVIGVAPPGFFGLEVGRSFDIALPICSDPIFSDDGKGRLEAGTDWWLSMFGRLAPGWTIDRASAHLASISPDLFRSVLPAGYPPISVTKYLNFKLAAYPARTGLSPLREEYESPLWLLLAIAALVLLIACANLTNLLLARATARAREIAVRLSLGASRWRIVRQLLTESLLLAAAGAALGVLLAQTLSRSLVAFLNTGSTTVTLPLGMDWRVVGFASALATATCVLFGLAPALKATRVGAGTVMREASRGTTASRDTVGLRQALVVVQVALSLALLFGSLLFARSLRNVMNVNPGFRSEGITVAGVNFRRLDLPVEQRNDFRRDLVDRIRAIPGVQSASSVSISPISGDANGNDVWPEADRSNRFSTLLNSAGTGYFTTLGIPIVAGRDFDERDTPSSQRVAIVSEAFAAKLGKHVPVVGSRFVREATPSTPEQQYLVVGVVSDSKYLDLKENPRPVAFFADRQSPRPMAYTRLVVRSSLPAPATTAAITNALANVDPRIGVAYTVLTTQIRDTLVRERLLATLSGGFGALAALLTIVGLYGLVAYTVTRRTNEIGVRMALGATRADIARLILRETGLLVVVGAGIGIVIALAGGRAAAALLFGVRPEDPLTLAAALLALAAIACVASLAPARRATRIEPVAALRVD